LPSIQPCALFFTYPLRFTNYFRKLLCNIGIVYTIEIKAQGILGITAYENEVPLINIH